MTNILRNWHLESWKKFNALQQPKYEDQALLNQVLSWLSYCPGLVQIEEIHILRNRLALADQDKVFIIQGGDCAESFANCNEKYISAQLQLLTKMTRELKRNNSITPLVIGRIAGQFAKPRSEESENIGGLNLPVFRGESINAPSAHLESRFANPLRLLQAYENAANSIKTIRQKPIFTSHEGLHLPFEQSLTRQYMGKIYNQSAHFLWIGDRTRQLDGAHVEFFRGIYNPIGIKVGPSANPQEIVEVAKRLNPKKEKGKIVLICRFGCKLVQHLLPQMIEAIDSAQVPVLFLCDPMHGNTLKVKNTKTRFLSDILKELEDSFEIHTQMRHPLNGIHLEMTAAQVAEVVSAENSATEESYQSLCDPRLNEKQSMELAKLCSVLLNGTKTYLHLPKRSYLSNNASML